MRRALLSTLAVLALSVGCGDESSNPLGTDPNELKPVVSASMSEVAIGATVTTDKPDYAPGETVTITGTGWDAGETVRLVLTEDPAIHEARGWDVVADDAGGFVDKSFSPEAHHVGVVFTLTATGQTSGKAAETTFTDGNVQVVTNGPTFTLDWTRYNASTTCGGTSTNGSATAVTVASGTPFQTAVQDNWSIKVTVAATSQAGGAFTGWTIPSGVPATQDPSNSRILCVQGASGSTLYSVTANYAAAQAAASMSAVSGSGTYGETATLTATLKSGSTALSNKTISFKLNGAAVGTALTDPDGVATLSGVSLTGINAGTYTNAVEAIFSSEAAYSGSSAKGDLTVGKATATVTITNLNQTYDGSPKPVSVSTAPTGLTVNVSYSGTANDGSSYGPSSTSPTNAGTYSVTATVQDNNYEGSDTKTLTIAKASQTITGFDLSNLSKTYGDGPFQITGVTGGGSGNPLVFASTTAATCSVSGNTVTILGAGKCTITANQAGNYNYEAATEVSQSFDIAKAPLTVSILDGSQSPYNKTIYYSDPVPQYTASYSGFVNGDDENDLGGVSSIGFYQGSTGPIATPTAVGTYTVRGTLTSNNYSIAFNPGQLQILAWTPRGFFEPVDMIPEGIWNTVKGGSTVPLKFELFKGSTELTVTSSVKSFSATGIACPNNPYTDQIEFTTTGGTSLRYDATAGQFIQNWQTPKKPGYCYKAVMTAQDNTSIITAYFMLK